MGMRFIHLLGMGVVIGLCFQAVSTRAVAQDQMFTWTDEHGLVHFSNSAPADGAHATTRTLATHPENADTAGGSAFQPVPLEVSHDQKIVRVHLEGSHKSLDVRMIVDTGAQRTLLAPELANELGVRLLRTEIMGGVTGVAVGKVVELETIRVGTEELRNLEVSVGKMPGLNLLGMDVLNRLELRVGRDTLDREHP